MVYSYVKDVILVIPCCILSVAAQLWPVCTLSISILVNVQTHSKGTDQPDYVGPPHAAKTALTHLQRRPVVSGTRTTAAHHSHLVKYGPPLIGLVPAHPTDARLDLENSEAESTPWTLCHVPQTIPEKSAFIVTRLSTLISPVSGFNVDWSVCTCEVF